MASHQRCEVLRLLANPATPEAVVTEVCDALAGDGTGTSLGVGGTGSVAVMTLRAALDCRRGEEAVSAARFTCFGLKLARAGAFATLPLDVQCRLVDQLAQAANAQMGSQRSGRRGQR